MQQSTYGGSAGGTGKAENNTVTLTNGTVDGDVYGGVADSGVATGNKVYIKGGSATNSRCLRRFFNEWKRNGKQGIH